jgi:hypothetical protein
MRRGAGRSSKSSKPEIPSKCPNPNLEMPELAPRIGISNFEFRISNSDLNADSNPNSGETSAFRGRDRFRFRFSFPGRGRDRGHRPGSGPGPRPGRRGRRVGSRKNQANPGGFGRIQADPGRTRQIQADPGRTSRPTSARSPVGQVARRPGHPSARPKSVTPPPQALGHSSTEALGHSGTQALKH